MKTSSEFYKVVQWHFLDAKDKFKTVMTDILRIPYTKKLFKSADFWRSY